jgi:putative transposase
VCHSDAGPQGGFTSIRYSERLAEICAAPSIGSVGDSHDCALAESVHNLYKREIVKAREPCKTIDDLELATLGLVTR